jgi:hypothetical protein
VVIFERVADVIAGSRSRVSLAAIGMKGHRHSALVKQDVLLLAGSQDHYVPTEQLHQQIKMLTNARSGSSQRASTRRIIVR